MTRNRASLIALLAFGALPLAVAAQPRRPAARDAGAPVRDAGPPVAQADAGSLQTIPAPAPAALTPRTLSVATLAPAGSTWMRTLDAWNRELRRRTNQTLSLRFYPNGVQGDEDEVVRKIRAGRIDGGALTAVGLAQVHRPTLFLQAPGLFSDDAALDRARDALRPELDTAFARAGFTLVGWGDAGTDRVFSDRAIRAPADLASTRLFLWREDPLSPALYGELGVRGVPMQLPEVLTALQTRTLDTVFAPPVAVASLQWAAHVTHMLDMPIATEVGALVFGRAQVESLAPEQQTALRETAAQFAALLVRNVRRDDAAAIPAMRERGLIVDTPTDAQRAQWQAAFTRTRARLAGVIADAEFIARVEAAARR